VMWVLSAVYVSFVVVASVVTLLKLVHEYNKERVR
jgi:hypothetical protein